MPKKKNIHPSNVMQNMNKKEVKLGGKHQNHCYTTKIDILKQF